MPTGTNAHWRLLRTLIHRLVVQSTGACWGLLSFEEGFLAIQSTGETRETSVGADDSVTGDEDGNRIAADRGTDGSTGRGFVHCRSQLAIGPSLTKRNRAEFGPHRALKFCPAWGQREREFLQLASEVLIQLADGLLKRLGLLLPACVSFRRMLVILKVEARHGSTVADEQ